MFSSDSIESSTEAPAEPGARSRGNGVKIKPKVALIHNRYQQRGGEDAVFYAEESVLRAHGHSVVQYCVDNDVIAHMNPVRLAASTFWNARVRRDLGLIFVEERPEVAHFHNTFPLISPAGYYAARERGIPVVQTLHNYRLLCPSAVFFRDGAVCEDCLVKRSFLPAIRHACYRGSRAATAVTAGMVTLHRSAHTWSKAVNLYVALTEFARRKFIEGGLPPDRIVVKPNFLLTDPGLGDHQGGFALFVGRLSVEKGLSTLLKAWSRIGKSCPLKIVGGGPMESLATKARPGLEWLGPLPSDEVITLMKEAAFLIFPWECFEGGFPMTVVEAIATGLPVIAGRQGGVTEVLEHGESAILFEATNDEALTAAVAWALANRRETREIGRRARKIFRSRFTVDQHYRKLCEIYELARSR